MYEDGDGQQALTSTPVPAWLPERRVVSGSTGTRLPVGQKSDWLPGLLEFAGWALLGLSLFGALGLYSDAQSYGSDGDTSFAVVVGAAGAIQSLLILAVSRLVKSQREAADNTRKMVELLRVAVERE
jgi:hypothetical protein